MGGGGVRYRKGSVRMPFVYDGGWGGTQCKVLWNTNIKRLAPVDRWTEIIYWMDVWMDVWMDGYMDRWMDGWMDGGNSSMSVGIFLFRPASRLLR